MITTMYGTSSVGLTATQVGVHQRIAVIDVPESLVQPIVLINPVIAESKEEKNITEEKCLSIPGTSRFVYRAEKINVTALDAFGNTINFSASGTLSICIQHMIDHMNGILLTKSLSQ
ncbi:peptide deformylase [Klebsiella pneumoniae]|nr:peptide deformylase [Klebsiella pneumoniae]HBX4015850.1 peptide deformylase [Klebsiella pneumoniae subsp. pneumoniae]HDC91806.1 peptide deformylase [Klebsiella pneumoniae]